MLGEPTDHYIDTVLTDIWDDLRRLGRDPFEHKAARGPDWPDEFERKGSRFVGPNEPGLVEHVARGGSIKRAEPRGSEVKSIGSLMTKALAEGSGESGGFLVPPQIATEITTLMRARVSVLRMPGVTTIPVAKELSVTSISSGAAAYWVAENAAIPISEQTFAQEAILRPRNLAALVPLSLRLLCDASVNPAVEEVVRRDLAEVLALRMDLSFLQGLGGTEPLGIINQSGLTAAPDLGPDGDTIDFDTLKDVVANLREVNSEFRNPGWIMAPRTLSNLEKLKVHLGRVHGGPGAVGVRSDRQQRQLVGNAVRNHNTDTNEPHRWRLDRL